MNFEYKETIDKQRELVSLQRSDRLSVSLCTS